MRPADAVEPEDSNDLDEDDKEDGSAGAKHLDDCDDENCDDHDYDDDYDDDDKDDLEHGDEVPPPVGEGGQGAKIDSSEQSRHKPLSEEGGRISNH